MRSPNGPFGCSAISTSWLWGGHSRSWRVTSVCYGVIFYRYVVILTTWQRFWSHLWQIFSLEEKSMVFVQNGTLTGGRKWPSKPRNYPMRPEMVHLWQEMTAHMRNSLCDWAVVIARCPAVEKTSAFCFLCFLYTAVGKGRSFGITLAPSDWKWLFSIKFYLSL